MIGIVVSLVVVAALMGGVAVAFGWGVDSTQAGRRWYPADSDPEPWRCD